MGRAIVQNIHAWANDTALPLHFNKTTSQVVFLYHGDRYSICPEAWIEHIVTQHGPEGIDYATTGAQPDERMATCAYALLEGKLGSVRKVLSQAPHSAGQ